MHESFVREMVDLHIERPIELTAADRPGRWPLARFPSMIPLVLASAYVTAICRPRAAAGVKFDDASTGRVRQSYVFGE
jgi:hypothetical protein